MDGYKNELYINDISLFSHDCLSIGYFLASIAVTYKGEFAVDLGGCRLGDMGIKIFIQSLHKSLSFHGEIIGHLKISLGYNDITGEGASYIAGELRTTRVLRNLSLFSNPIGDKGLYYIAEALTINTSLVKLDLRWCSLRITQENGPVLTKMLQKNKILRKFHLSWNKAISDDQASYIIEGLKKNTTLRILNLEYCGTTRKGINSIQRHTLTCKIIHDSMDVTHYTRGVNRPI